MKNIKKILLFSLIFFSLNAFSQKDLDTGFVVLKTNDTISGMLKNKNYYSTFGVKIYQGNNKIRCPKRILSEIHVNDDFYVKSDIAFFTQVFYKKDISGKINLYTYRNARYICSFDTDVCESRLKPAIRFYCSDYPNLSDTIKKINNENIDVFVENYNDWKIENPDSKSFFEQNIHKKPFINFKMSFFLPGAGFEIGLHNKISINIMLKNGFGYRGTNDYYIDPFIHTQLRYYHNINKRKAENKRTYKYTGNYICLMNGYYLDNKSIFFGVEYGWQRMINKHWYYNLGIGIGKLTTGNQNFVYLFDYDLGYNF